jgi:hypothetical protein
MMGSTIDEMRAQIASLNATAGALILVVALLALLGGVAGATLVLRRRRPKGDGVPRSSHPKAARAAGGSLPQDLVEHPLPPLPVELRAMGLPPRPKVDRPFATGTATPS